MFSIIVPCYNLESWIRECLDSVLFQSFLDWECIVVDDESKDGSPAICDEYAVRDSRFRVIHQKNAGEGGARNAGLAVAQGEWVFFLDGDDVMAPRALELLSGIVTHFPHENLIRFGFQNFNDGDSYPVVNRSGQVRGPVDISRQIAVGDYCVYVWQFLFRRVVIADMKFDRYKRGADRTFIVPVLCNRTQSFVATDDVCYFYRKRDGSAMHTRPSVQTLKDELSHRVDVVECIDTCGKKMPYAGGYWLEAYCLRQYIRIVEFEGDYTCEEQQELIDWFYHELPRICRAKGYSFGGKITAQLFRVLRGRFGRCFLVKVLPGFCRYARALLNPVSLCQKIKRRMCRHG